MKTPQDDIRYPIDGRAERIIAAALDEFARRGFAGARETVIARRAGVSPATLRLYFPSKDELFREVVRSTIVDSLQTIEPDTLRHQSSGSAVERLRGFASGFWRSMDQPGNAALLRLSVGELPRYPELALFHATEVIGRFAARLERTLAEGAATGELRISDPRAASRVIVSALMTHAHWFAYPSVYSAITGPDRERTEAVVKEVLIDALRPRDGSRRDPRGAGSAA